MRAGLLRTATSLVRPWQKGAGERVQSERARESNSAQVRYRLLRLFLPARSGASASSAGGLQPGLEHVAHVYLRGILDAQLENDHYRVDWDNALHPEPDAFARVAARFDDKLREVLGG